MRVARSSCFLSLFSRLSPGPTYKIWLLVNHLTTPDDARSNQMEAAFWVNFNPGVMQEGKSIVRNRPMLDKKRGKTASSFGVTFKMRLPGGSLLGNSKGTSPRFSPEGSLGRYLAHPCFRFLLGA